MGSVWVYGHFWLGRVSWSPDGSRILYTGAEDVLYYGEIDIIEACTRICVAAVERLLCQGCFIIQVAIVLRDISIRREKS